MANDSDLITALATQDLARLVRLQELAEEERQLQEARRQARAARSASLGDAVGAALFAAFVIGLECFLLICFVTFPADFGFGIFFQGIGQAIVVGFLLGLGIFLLQAALVFFSRVSGSADTWWAVNDGNRYLVSFRDMPMAAGVGSLFVVTVLWRVVFGTVPFSEWFEVSLVSIGVAWIWIAISAWRNGEERPLFGGLAAVGGITVAVVFIGFMVNLGQARNAWNQSNDAIIRAGKRVGGIGDCRSRPFDSNDRSRLWLSGLVSCRTDRGLRTTIVQAVDEDGLEKVFDGKVPTGVAYFANQVSCLDGRWTRSRNRRQIEQGPLECFGRFPRSGRAGMELFFREIVVRNRKTGNTRFSEQADPIMFIQAATERGGINRVLNREPQFVRIQKIVGS